MELPEKNKEVPLAEIKKICEEFGLMDLWAKIEKDPARPQYIQTVWGVGYKFSEAEDRENGQDFVQDDLLQTGRRTPGDILPHRDLLYILDPLCHPMVYQGSQSETQPDTGGTHRGS